MTYRACGYDRLRDSRELPLICSEHEVQVKCFRGPKMLTDTESWHSIPNALHPPIHYPTTSFLDGQDVQRHRGGLSDQDPSVEEGTSDFCDSADSMKQVKGNTSPHRGMGRNLSLSCPVCSAAVCHH